MHAECLNLSRKKPVDSKGRSKGDDAVYETGAKVIRDLMSRRAKGAGRERYSPQGSATTESGRTARNTVLIVLALPTRVASDARG